MSVDFWDDKYWQWQELNFTVVFDPAKEPDKTALGLIKCDDRGDHVEATIRWPFRVRERLKRCPRKGKKQIKAFLKKYGLNSELWKLFAR